MMKLNINENLQEQKQEKLCSLFNKKNITYILEESF